MAYKANGRKSKSNPQERDTVTRTKDGRYLTAREIKRLGWTPTPQPVDPFEETVEIVLGNGIQEFRAALAAKERGWSLLELTVVMLVGSILMTLAMPSAIYRIQREALQSQVATLKSGLLQLPPLPLDSTWKQSGNTYTKQLTVAPVAGVTITVVQPQTAGGNWTCSSTLSGFPNLRC